MVETSSNTSREEVKSDLTRLLSRGYIELAPLARLIGVSYPTIYNMRKRGYIDAIRVGGRWHVYADEVRRFLREGNYVKNKEGQQ